MFSSISASNYLLKYYYFFLATFLISAMYFYLSSVTKENTINFLLFGLIISSGIAVIFYIKRRDKKIVTISDGVLLIKQNEDKSNSDYKLPCHEIKYFETKFNEIVIHDTKNEKICIKLDKIKSEKQRWEIKELLRQHVPQNKYHKNIQELELYKLQNS